MEDPSVIEFPRAASAAVDDVDASAGMSALAEIDAAIALVAGRAARRVRLTALPFVEQVAGLALAHARAAGMAFAFERPERAGVVTVTIGPLDGAAPRPDRADDNLAPAAPAPA